MTDLLFEISDDVNQYLNLDELTTVSTVSTDTFFRGLNNMKFNRFLPYENGEEILRKLEIEEKVQLTDIKRSSNLNFANENGQTILFRAIYHDNTEIVKILINLGNNNYESSPHNCSPWRTIADVNLINKYGTTPLIFAVKKNIEMVKILINGGTASCEVSPRNCSLQRTIADVNLADERGWTPLLWELSYVA